MRRSAAAQQLRAGYGAVAVAVAAAPSTVAEATTVAEAAGTERARVVNACAELAPGATVATDFAP